MTFHTLNPVDALVQAAFHMVLHHPESYRLIWVSDIALLWQKIVARKEMQLLRRRTADFNLNLAMEKALKLAQLWFGIRPPDGHDDFTNFLEPDLNEKTEFEYVTNHCATDIRISGYLETFRKSPNKIGYLVKFLFPSPDYIRATHPPSKNWLLPFSYIRRWAHWLTKLFQYRLNN